MENKLHIELLAKVVGNTPENVAKYNDDVTCTDCLTALQALETALTEKHRAEEYILCAAIWYKDLESQNFLPFNCESGVVVTGWRHSNCIAVLNTLYGKRSVTTEIGDYTQGFLTNKNRFVDRQEGWIIAEKANQINDRVRGSQHTLYSEDLY